MGVVFGAWIDDGEIVRADDVGVGALEGEDAWIVGDNPDNARHEFARRRRRRIPCLFLNSRSVIVRFLALMPEFNRCSAWWPSCGAATCDRKRIGAVSSSCVLTILVELVIDRDLQAVQEMVGAGCKTDDR